MAFIYFWIWFQPSVAQDISWQTNIAYALVRLSTTMFEKPMIYKVFLLTFL